MIAARSESLPSVATRSATLCASSSTGKAPRLSTRASERASLLVKLPVIVTWPVNERLLHGRRRLDDVVEHDRQLAASGSVASPL